jgi:lipopolysaccharide biosynthesis glycosyltransferase
LFPNHFAEQTWMNIMAHLCDLDLQELDPSFNCMTSVEEHFGLNRYMDAQMIHYAGQSNDMAKLCGQIEADIKKLEEEIR